MKSGTQRLQGLLAAALKITKMLSYSVSPRSWLPLLRRLVLLSLLLEVRCDGDQTGRLFRGQIKVVLEGRLVVPALLITRY